MWDVLVAGAGPAGSVAAHILACKGRQVLLVDDVPRPAIKVGETLPGAALRLLRTLNLPVPDDRGPHIQIGGNLSSWGSEELIATDFFRDPDGPGWRLDRLQFDAALRESAICSGATFKKGRVLQTEREGETWKVKFDDGEITTARWLIDATGRSASLARKLGARRLRDTPLTALYGIGFPQPECRLNRTIVEAVPAGWWYGGMLPSGSLIIGFHLLPQDAKQLSASPQEWTKAMRNTRYISAAFHNVTFKSPLHAIDASSSYLNHFSGEGWLACGDAAMSFDPISSQGIMSALHTGMTAAAAVHAALAGDAIALNSYTNRLEEIRRTYSLRCRTIYQSETRWLNNSFWLQFQQAGQEEQTHGHKRERGEIAIVRQ
ncbi:MAG TPA: NAD(P)/FAD-dependent oxidoreductase [Candidatus Angelobacter sp.]|jgi:flavin-dependent dehydrogenase